MMLDYPSAEIKKLKEDPELLLLIEDFDCKDPDLNEFLRKDALEYFNGRLAVTYLLLYDKELVGFFCISNECIEVDKEDKKILEDLGKRQRKYPALLIGRLGIQENQKGKGFGTLILDWVAEFASKQSEQVGCRYLAVEAKNQPSVIGFYRKFGFKELVSIEKNDTLPLYFDILEKKY